MISLIMKIRAFLNKVESGGRLNKKLFEILEITEKIFEMVKSKDYNLDELLNKREKLIKDFLSQNVDIQEEDREIFQKIQEKSQSIEKSLKAALDETAQSLDYNFKGIRALKDGYLKYFENSRFKFERKG